jgi:heme/copper-type cytochrome/quinol oxidase subunit 3
LSEAVRAMHEEYTSTGLPNRKLAMWAFIGSECMLFGSLIINYLINHTRNLQGPYPEELLNIPFITVTTFVLLMSSLMMVLGFTAVERGDMKWGKVWLLMTALFGMIFLGGQVYEFSHFAHEGLGLSTNLFGASFYLLTGFHGAHVTVGVIWLLSLVVLAQRGRITQRNTETVEIAGLYWHFVDIVWIVLFVLIYLMS